MDATYRADLDRLNEVNFQRFDAKVEQRLATVRADLIKWAFLFWMPTALAVLGLYFR